MPASHSKFKSKKVILYTMVRKKKTDEYDTLPNDWIIDKETAVYPLKETTSTLYNLAKGSKFPAFYDTIPIEIYKKDVEDFDKAMRNCVRLTRGQQTLSASEREVAKGKRKTKVPQKLLSDASSECESTDSEPRERKKSKKNHSKFETVQNSKASKNEYKASSSSRSKTSCNDEFNAKTGSKFETSRVDEIIAKLKGQPTPPLPPIPPNRDLSRGNGSCSFSANQDFEDRRGTPVHETTKQQSASSNRLPHSRHPELQRSSTPTFMEMEENETFGLSTPQRNSPDGPRHSTVSPQNLSSTRKNLFSSPKKLKGKCKIGKKLKHTCAFGRLCNPLDAISHVLCSLSCDMEKVKQNMKFVKLLSDSKNGKGSGGPKIFEEEDIEIPEDILSRLPLDSMDDLTAFEEQLLTVKDLFENLVKYLRPQCKSDISCSKSARNIAKELLQKNLLARFSLKGGFAAASERKTSFNKLEVYRLLLRVIKDVWKDACPDYQSLAEKSLGPFLTQTKSKD